MLVVIVILGINIVVLALLVMKKKAVYGAAGNDEANAEAKKK